MATYLAVRYVKLDADITERWIQETSTSSVTCQEVSLTKFEDIIRKKEQRKPSKPCHHGIHWKPPLSTLFNLYSAKT